MNRLYCLLAAIIVLGALFVPPALAKNAPDARVKGLWLKATGLPKGAGIIDDGTRKDDEPCVIYGFGKGPDGPAVTMKVGRHRQKEKREEKFLVLDKKALAAFVGPGDFARTAKNLTFADAPRFGEKFTYPCQMATYTDSKTGLRHTWLFIQTDGHMFSVNVARGVKDKKYSDADVETWLMNLEMVEQ